MKKVLTIIIILTFTMGISAFTVCNDLECIFSENPEKTVLSVNLINGAVHFLKSKSYADLLLYEYEKSALQNYDYSVSFDHVEKAILQLESSRAKYSEAIRIGKRIGYNEKKVPWFKNYDYNEFIGFNNLNKETAQRVMNYLAESNIIGIYQQFINDIDDILNTLYLIRDRVKTGTKPEITIIWKLLQQYSEASLFGNYATVMGTTILGECNE